jgi:hypothetical protein
MEALTQTLHARLDHKRRLPITLRKPSAMSRRSYCVTINDAKPSSGSLYKLSAPERHSRGPYGLDFKMSSMIVPP